MAERAKGSKKKESKENHNMKGSPSRSMKRYPCLSSWIWCLPERRAENISDWEIRVEAVVSNFTPPTFSFIQSCCWWWVAIFLSFSSFVLSSANVCFSTSNFCFSSARSFFAFSSAQTTSSIFAPRHNERTWSFNWQSAVHMPGGTGPLTSICCTCRVKRDTWICPSWGPFKGKQQGASHLRFWFSFSLFAFRNGTAPPLSCFVSLFLSLHGGCRNCFCTTRQSFLSIYSACFHSVRRSTCWGQNHSQFEFLTRWPCA